MYPLSIIAEMLSTWIETKLAQRASHAAKFSLLTEQAGEFDDREATYAELIPYECDFAGYSQILDADQGGPDSAWLPMEASGLVERSGFVDVQWVRDPDAGIDGAKTQATHIAYWTQATNVAPWVLAKLWVLATPRTFGVDGDVFKWRLRMKGTNAEDVP